MTSRVLLLPLLAWLIALAGGTSMTGAFAPWQDPCAAADAALDDLHLAPSSDERNEVFEVYSRTSLSGGWSPKADIRHDAAGNLVFDGTFIYHYDAWNRLVQVSAGVVDPSGGGTPVAGRPYQGLVSGPMLKHSTYDGLGRLIRTQSPFPTPQQAAQGNVRSERFYYDGIRRIQETRLDPALSLEKALASEDPEEQLTCPPKPDPATMRVPGAAGFGQETLEDEADKAFDGTDCGEAARGRRDAGGGPERGAGFGGERADLRALACAVWRDEGRRGAAAEGVGG